MSASGLVSWCCGVCVCGGDREEGGRVSEMYMGGEGEEVKCTCIYLIHILTYLVLNCNQ